MLSSFVRFLSRTGGVLVTPRRAVASLAPGEGMRDGLWLGLLYLVGGHLYPVIEALATLVAVRNWGGVMVVFSSLGVLLAPILASILAETILGAERGTLRGLCLAPLVLVGVGVEVWARLDAPVVWPGWAPALVGTIGSAALAFRLRSTSEATATSRARSWVHGAAALSGIVVAAAVVVGGADVRRGVSSWSTLGPLPPGEQVADFRVMMLDGNVVDSAGLVGKVSVVTFWATWCGVCVGELSDLDQLAARYQDKPVQFVAVNREGGGLSVQQAVSLVRAFARERGLTLPMAVDDGSMTHTFRVGPIPHTVVFDTTGTVRHVHQGRVTSATLEAEIDALLQH